MGYARAAFAAGIAVGFIAGARAGREQYDRIVKYSRKAVTSPPVQRAGRAISAKATDLTRSAAARAPKAAGDVTKAAGDVTKKARDRVAKINVPKTPKMPKAGGKPGKHGWRSDAASPDAPPVVTQSSVNGDRKATTYND